MPYVTWPYLWSNSQEEPAALGAVQIDEQQPPAASWLWISDTDTGATNHGDAFDMVTAGMAVRLIDTTDSAAYQWFKVTGVSVPKTGYHEIPVGWHLGGDKLSNNATIDVSILAASTFPTGFASLPPTADDLAFWLSITASQRGPDVDALLTAVALDATQYELGRASFDRLIEDGASPPDTVPEQFYRAVVMHATALYKRRNSINGFDGYDDLGTVPVRGSDPEIEKLVDRWRAWAWA